MKIAIVAPASVPYVMGGAENLYQSLSNHLINERSCSCEIITLPSPEGNFDEVLDSYRNFSELNLDHFDLVISTKYPSWMISHKNHICYMLHPLRGLYDTYHLMDLPSDLNWEKEGLKEICEWMDNALQAPRVDNVELDVFFKKIEEIKIGGKNSSLFSFPGPFIRRIIHFLDSYALSPCRIKKHFAISSTVAKRKNYFPESVNATVLYPAPLIDSFDCKEFKHVFTASRLDSPKRIDLLIEAFKLVPHDIPFIIAGEGPQREDLELLAEGDGRIKFVGRVNNEQLLSYYADALVVAYAPYEEDYGYITIEAMKSSKPVITTIDSGGPNEFVRDGENGFSVLPRPESIAEKLTFFCQHIDVARDMGLHANSTVNKVEWSRVVDELVEQRDTPCETSRPKSKPKMVVAVTFPVYPPRGGGQARVYNLYRNLTEHYDIEIVCLCDPDLSSQSKTIAPGLVETRIPLSKNFIDYDQANSKDVDWIPVTDISAIEGYKLVEGYLEALKGALDSADIVITCHPFLIKAIREVNTSVPLWFEAQDVDYDLKSHLLPDNEASRSFLEMVYEVERYCWCNSEIVFACTQEDLLRLEELYGETSATRIVVPNGVDYKSSVFLEGDQRKQLKLNLGLENVNTVLFMGSWHGPNLEAAEQLIILAPDFPDVYFFLIGSAGLALKDRKLPSNIILFGTLDDDEKKVVMCASDVAINPMLSGSGSNLKMLDFLSFGLPVISTSFGARGLMLEPHEHYILSEIESLSLELNRFFALKGRYRKMQILSREFVKNNYSWKTISKNFYENILSR